MNLWSILERTARSHPRRLAAVDGEVRATYADVHERCAALAASLRADGVRAGDRIAILEPNSLAYLEAYFAAAALGAILVPLNTRLAAPELALLLEHSGARHWIAHGSFAELVEAALARGPAVGCVRWTEGGRALGACATRAWAEPASASAAAFEPAPATERDVAQIYYTSGTTGAPKGVMLTHGNVLRHALAARAELALSDRDVWIHAAPMFHLADAWATFAITECGGTHVFCARFDERAVLDLLEQERATLTNLVPTMLQRLVAFPGAAQRDWSALRMILSGGAPIAPAVVRRVMDTFRCEYVQTYGLTETSPFLTLSLLRDHLKSAPEELQFAWRAKTGRAFAAVELQVAGEDGRPVANDGVAIGEIRARGPTVTPGYWNDPEATARAFADGWFCTGDLATIDAEGYLQIVDRKKDMIITGGEKVYSTEVESVLYAHPDVLECAVFGVADSDWGERVEAAVVLRSGGRASESELATFAREQLAGFKVPRRIRILPDLPKTGSGKIVKRLLRDSPAGRD